MNITIPKLSLWEKRMNVPHPKEIGSYFPDIGRGSIEHDAVSHEEVEKGLMASLHFSIFEILSRFF